MMKFLFFVFFTRIGIASCYIFLCFKVFNRQVGSDQLMCLFAAAYKSEAEAGEALAEAIKTGLVKRKDLFVTTKVYLLNIDVFLANFLGKKKDL